MAQKPVDYVTQIIGNTPVVKLRNVVDDFFLINVHLQFV